MKEDKTKEEEILEEEETQEEGEVYVTFDIATYPSDFTLAGIYQMWKDIDIVIPDFQREFVWSIKQSSLLIESFLLGLPVPPVFFYIDEDNSNLVIDGQQRILRRLATNRVKSAKILTLALFSPNIHVKMMLKRQ